MEERGKIICKKSDNKAFKLGENWYNLNDNVVPYLEKMSKGDEVIVEFEKKGVSRYVSKLVNTIEASRTTVDPEQNKSTTGYACEICGKELKDGKFKKCYMCNKNKAVKKEEPKPEETKTDASKSTYKPYDNPEKQAAIQKGNALNAAGAAISGNLQGTDPDTIAQGLIMVAERALEWLRTE